MEKEVAALVAVSVGQRQVQCAVVVVVDPFDAVIASVQQALAGQDLFKPAVAEIAVEQIDGNLLARLAFIMGDEEVQPAVIVVVAPGRRHGVAAVIQPGLGRDFGKRPVAVIAVQ
ncbi:hypothetical protein D3C73_1001510 [compost metagenome]